MHHVLPYCAQYLRHGRKCAEISSKPEVAISSAISSLVPLWCHQIHIKIFVHQYISPAGALADGRNDTIDS